MRIFTDTYSHYRGNQGVNIMRKPPVWGDYYKDLSVVHPPWRLVMSVKKATGAALDAAIANYIKEYVDQLYKVGKDRIIDSLVDGDVLLCNCAKGRFCHRQILGAFLAYHGVDVIELW